MKDILIIDTETGGLNPDKHTLLTVSVKPLYLDISPMKFKLRPQAGKTCEDEALRINGLDLNELIFEGLDLEKFNLFFFALLEKWAKELKIKRFRLLGHNVKFDIGFLEKVLDFNLSSENINYHYLDTCVIAGFLRDAKKIKVSSLRLATLHKELIGGDLSKSAHDSDVDVLMTELIFKYFLRLIK